MIDDMHQVVVRVFSELDAHEQVRQRRRQRDAASAHGRGVHRGEHAHTGGHVGCADRGGNAGTPGGIVE